jgi:hypothetical protein
MFLIRKGLATDRVLANHNHWVLLSFPSATPCRGRLIQRWMSSVQRCGCNGRLDPGGAHCRTPPEREPMAKATAGTRE